MPVLCGSVSVIGKAPLLQDAAHCMSGQRVPSLIDVAEMQRLHLKELVHPVARTFPSKP